MCLLFCPAVYNNDVDQNRKEYKIGIQMCAIAKDAGIAAHLPNPYAIYTVCSYENKRKKMQKEGSI
jgi:hypothetical protein